MVTAMHDGVPYTFAMRDAYGKLDVSRFPHALKHYNLTVDRHHDLVKAAYDHMVGQGLPNSWAMLGGDASCRSS